MGLVISVERRSSTKCTGRGCTLKNHIKYRRYLRIRSHLRTYICLISRPLTNEKKSANNHLVVKWKSKKKKKTKTRKSEIKSDGLKNTKTREEFSYSSNNKNNFTIRITWAMKWGEEEEAGINKTISGSTDYELGVSDKDKQYECRRHRISICQHWYSNDFSYK